MTIENIELKYILDNPFNPRSSYNKDKISDLASSIQQIGLQEVPRARKCATKEGYYELAFGGYRLRAFKELAKKDKAFDKMPLDIAELSDEMMALIALEENLKRENMRSLDAARAIANYFKLFPDTKQTEFARKLSMTQANMSNMLRLITLPAGIQEKIDTGRINSTMGRELLTLSGICVKTTKWENGKSVEKTITESDLMESAISKTMAPGSMIRAFDTEANTVEGMQKAINSVASENLRPLERGKGSPDLVFDAIECIVKCKKCLITRPKKEESLHWCLDFACWDKKQEDHRSAIAAEAKKKAAAEITSKATGAPPPKIISQEISATSDMVEAIQKSYSLQEVIDPDKGTIKDPFMYNQEPYVCIAQSLPEEHVTKFKCYKLTYPDDFEGEAKPYTAVLPEEHAKSPKGFYHGVLVNWLKEPVVLEGPEVTFVYKSEESKQQPQKEELKEYRMFHKDGSSGGSIESISPVQAMIDLKGNPTEGDILKAKSPGGGWSKFKFTDADLDTMACASKPPLQPAKPDVPPEVLDKAKKEAGTRAEPFDIGIASTGTFKVIGDDLLPWTKIDNPEECQKTCTHGFHYAFNSHSKETEDPNDHYVCTDLACLEKKIFALISKTEDEGKANKELERKAVMEAIEKTKAIDKPRMKLIILSLVRGCYIASKDLPEGIEKAETLVWKSIASDVEEKDRTITKLMKAIDDYPDDELARLITNLSLYSLAYHGDVAKYKIQLTDPLKWMGIKVEGKK